MFICLPTSRSKTQHFVNQAYVDYVKESGYDAVLIAEGSDPLKAVEICDGLLLPGGIDLDPTFYEEDNVHSLSVDPAKDDFERSLLHAFIGAGKPVFGICRGFQLIVREYARMQKNQAAIHDHTVYYQHINDHSLVSSLDIPRFALSHSIFADRNFLYGEEHSVYKRMFVNSMHHQALLLKPVSKAANARVIRNLDGMIVVATAAYGLETTKSMNRWRVAEAIMIRDWAESRIMAVQWHPEELRDTKLLKSFFDNTNGLALEIAAESAPKPTKKQKAKDAAGNTEEDG